MTLMSDDDMSLIMTLMMTQSLIIESHEKGCDTNRTQRN
jgi:hypothetical protein